MGKYLERIRHLNDELRYAINPEWHFFFDECTAGVAMQEGIVVLSPHVVAMNKHARKELLQVVRDFHFSNDCDPTEDHALFFVTVRATSYFAKIDVYDRLGNNPPLDLSDERSLIRVLHIGQRDEFFTTIH